MTNRGLCFIIASFTVCSALNASAATIKAASCSRADMTTAYNAASAGDTITVPAGTCSSDWTSVLTDSKGVTFQGAGKDVTTIGLSFTGPAIRMYHSNSRVTGFTFDCNLRNTSNTGAVQVGIYSTSACNSTYTIADWRIDNNKFIECGASSPVTGYNAISVFGYTYGVIDHNTFVNCNGECLNIGGDGPNNGITRSKDFGLYTNGTIYIEDNTWNYNNIQIENVIDGNSAARWVLRNNTINLTGSSGVQKLFEAHGTEVSMVCNASTNGDAGVVSVEAYNNDIYNGGSGGMSQLSKSRGARELVYNNTFHTANPSSVLALANYRSWNYNDGISFAVNARGYSDYCHDAESSYKVEGRAFGKTTLYGSLDSSTCPSVTSASGFPTYGSSILVDSEQIDFTGISGNQLTPCKRGANGTTATTHSSGASVDLFIFGNCLEQVTNTWVWGNKGYNGADFNVVSVENGTKKTGHNDYTAYDIKSQAQRPGNWQYRNDGTAYSYTPYPYPHPLTKGKKVLNPPTSLKAQ